MIDVVNDLGFDLLKMYFGEDYKITDTITLHPPTIGEIIEFGEMKCFRVLQILTGNTTTFRLLLWDNGEDWNKISDYHLFIRHIRALTPENTSLFFGDFDFSSLVPGMAEDSIVLCDTTGKIIIDESVYIRIAEYLRTIFDRHPKVEKAKGKTTKEWMIEDDRRNIEIAKRQNKASVQSYLLPLISGVLNHPGFKYKKDELKNVGVMEFFDSVKRLRIYEASTALLKGMYSGMIDVSKVPNIQKEVDWLRDLYEVS